MATFLNREGILHHFDRIFHEAKCELVMVVPFIKLTSEIVEQINEADKKGIQILIVYRENSLSEDQRKLLFSFSNVTVLHHPNVHAKCYLNERSLIISSMNLYDTSIKNNREMGILLDYFNDELKRKDTSFNLPDDSQPIEEAIDEINTILNSSTPEKLSPFIKENGFRFNILKSRVDLVDELLNELNKKTQNKKFQTIEVDENLRSTVCLNFYENVDLELDVNFGFNESNLKTTWVKSIFIHLRHPEKQLEKLFNSFGRNIEEFSYKYYKTYWNWHKTPIRIYRNTKQFPEIWEKGTNVDQIIGLIKGAEKVLADLKKEKLFIKVE